jgi:hypothetical protein
MSATQTRQLGHRGAPLGVAASRHRVLITSPVSVAVAGMDIDPGRAGRGKSPVVGRFLAISSPDEQK